jgi:serine/threonine protein kinase
MVQSTNYGDETEEVMIGGYPQSKLLEDARQMVEDRTKDWQNLDPHDEERIPRFHRDEIELARVLGKGGFFIVCEIRKITLRHNSVDEDSDSSDHRTLRESETAEDEDRKNPVVQSRHFMARHYLRHGKDCRYAFKTMQDVNHTDPDTFLNSVVDMAIEFKFLAYVRHPNILKMRAVSAGSLYQPNVFMILDKIYDTLEVRIGKWKKKEQSPFNRVFDFQKKKEKLFLAKRLLVAFDIASALAYLHDLKYVLLASRIVGLRRRRYLLTVFLANSFQSIMYRDLKPLNVGFDVRDDAKLFDFGLATEFRPEEQENRAYKLTGDTGTTRYMAPEVALSQPYTEKADVFSFGIM